MRGSYRHFNHMYCYYRQFAQSSRKIGRPESLSFFWTYIRRHSAVDIVCTRHQYPHVIKAAHARAPSDAFNINFRVIKNRAYEIKGGESLGTTLWHVWVPIMWGSLRLAPTGKCKAGLWTGLDSWTGLSTGFWTDTQFNDDHFQP